MDLAAYLKLIDSGVRRGSGVAVAELLALPLNGEHIDAMLVDQVNAKQSNLLDYCRSNLSQDAALASIVSNRLLSLCSLHARDLVQAFRHAHAAYNATLDRFLAIDGADAPAGIPLFVRVSNDLRVVAALADADQRSPSHDFLREALHDFTKGFSSLFKDRTPITSPHSKKRAILAAVNVLFKIYFRVNTLQLCSKIISVVEGPGHVMDNLSVFPACDVVTYKYYIGRLKMYEDRYEEARDNLRFALRHTPQSSLRNRQRILATLVPVEMSLGIMPRPEVGSRYGLHEYVALGDAARKGDLQTFNSVFYAHRRVLIRLGVYLVLENVRSIAYRNLFKRFHLISASTRLSIGAFEAALQTMGLDVDMDEVECIVSNLIFQQKIKGYLSHQKRVLIISKLDPFPAGAIVKRTKV